MLFEGYTGGGGKEILDGFMSSGDLGHLDAAGRLFVDGREDDMIVSGGENVFPQEVEEVILHMPSVADAAVVGVPDDEFGQRLRAAVVPAPGAAPTADEVRDHVRANLARYKVPRDVVFLDELPRNATGKVLRRVIAEDT
jgi:fatty-acyl-CoA synthase